MELVIVLLAVGLFLVGGALFLHITIEHSWTKEARRDGRPQ